MGLVWIHYFFQLIHNILLCTCLSLFWHLKTVIVTSCAPPPEVILRVVRSKAVSWIVSWLTCFLSFTRVCKCELFFFIVLLVVETSTILVGSQVMTFFILIPKSSKHGSVWFLICTCLYLSSFYDWRRNNCVIIRVFISSQIKLYRAFLFFFLCKGNGS